MCGHCSSHNAFLAASEIVQEPNISDSWTAALHEHGGYHRVCDVCHQAIMSASAPAMLFSASGDHFATTQVSTSPLTTSAAVPPEEHEAGSSMQRSISDLSDLGECPVCGTDLHQISEKSEQEKHVNACLESGTAPQIQNNHYLGERSRSLFRSLLSKAHVLTLLQSQSSCCRKSLRSWEKTVSSASSLTRLGTASAV